MYLPSSQLLIGELLKYTTHCNPDKEAFIFGEKRVTYNQLLNRTMHIAGWLQNEGVSKDTKVGFLCKNSLAFVELYLAVSLTDGVSVPMNYRLAANEIDYIVNNSDTQILFIDAEYLETIKSIRGNLNKVKKIVVIESNSYIVDSDMINYESIFEATVNYKENTTKNDEDANLIIYTSGTTGRPKGVVLTHKSMYVQSLNRIVQLGKRSEDNILIVPPLFHIAALICIPFICLNGATGYIHSEFNPTNILHTVQSEQINQLFLVPTMWNYLLQVPTIQNFDLSSIQLVSTGGAICPLELKKKIIETFYNAELIEGFGQSESLIVTSLLPKDSLRKTSSIGKPVINVRVRIVDDQMNDVPVGQPGEFIYQGPTMMKEYYNNPEATREAFKDGWFHSGDIVKMDDEGFIYIMDRKKDMIISGGENIYPAELEGVIAQHPDVLEVAVIGIPDQQWGESVKAFIVLKPHKKLLQKDIIKYCHARMASYKKPKVVDFIDELPRNASGKILKTRLRTI